MVRTWCQRTSAIPVGRGLSNPRDPGSIALLQLVSAVIMVGDSRDPLRRIVTAILKPSDESLMYSKQLQNMVV